MIYGFLVRKFIDKIKPWWREVSESPLVQSLKLVEIRAIQLTALILYISAVLILIRIILASMYPEVTEPFFLIPGLF